MRTADFHRRLIELGRRHGEIPRYGTPEWEALPSGDPRLFAAVVIAAECWRRDGTGRTPTDAGRVLLDFLRATGELR